MALISCPDCQGTLSSEAIQCPHCGRPAGNLQAVRAKGSEGCFLQTLNIGCVVVLVGIVGMALMFFLAMVVGGAMSAGGVKRPSGYEYREASPFASIDLGYHAALIPVVAVPPMLVAGPVHQAAIEWTDRSTWRPSV